jgi:hypothetical protein
LGDFSRFCCLNPDCADYGRRGASQLSACLRYGRDRQHRLLYCASCRARFSDRKGTPLLGARLPYDKLFAVLAHSLTAVASARPPAWSASARTPSIASPCWPAATPASSTMSWWAFPPSTTKVQLDEKWSFVGKKEKHCAPEGEESLSQGDQWDHVAFDPDSRLVLSVVVGKRTTGSAVRLLEDVRGRLGGRVPELVTSDEYAAYPEALLAVFGQEVVPPRTGKPGLPAGPRLALPEGLCHATVHKTRAKGRVVAAESRVVLGALPAGAGVSTSYLERQNATDRHRNARKGRKTYRFSKDWAAHAAMTAFTMYSYNFCWPVRTLREGARREGYRQRTPARAAGLADHVWTLREWLTIPAVVRTKAPALEA